MNPIKHESIKHESIKRESGQRCGRTGMLWRRALSWRAGELEWKV
ncbi:hypothetical protein [Massilia glaciei]|nr:hypothetical protein [Massilia glaciei]